MPLFSNGPDSDYWPNAPKFEAAYLHKFCVCRKFAGKGMTKIVTEAIKAECYTRGIRYIRLDTGLDEKKSEKSIWMLDIKS